MLAEMRQEQKLDEVKASGIVQVRHIAVTTKIAGADVWRHEDRASADANDESATPAMYLQQRLESALAA